MVIHEGVRHTILDRLFVRARGVGDFAFKRERAAKARGWLIGTSVVTAIGVPLLAVGLTYDRRQQPSEGFDLDFTGLGSLSPAD
jgi:hypothetical protein